MGGSLGVHEEEKTSNPVETDIPGQKQKEDSSTSLSHWTSWITGTKQKDWYQCDDGRNVEKYSCISNQDGNQSGNVQNEHHRRDVNRRSPDGQTPLIQALQNNDVDFVRDLIRHFGADVNFPGLKQYSAYRWDEVVPLIVAINSNRIQYVKLLCDAGARVNAVDRDGMTPLHYAARAGSVVIVTELLQHGAVLQQKKAESQPFHAACSYGHRDVAGVMVKLGVDVNKKNSDGWNGLHLAIRNGHRHLSLDLLQYGADFMSRDSTGRTPLMWACHKGMPDVAKQLVAMGANVNDTDHHGNTPLMFSVQPGPLSGLRRRLMFSNPSSTETSDYFEEYIKTLQSSNAVMDVLIEAGCDLNADDESVVRYCIKAGNIPGIITLLRHGAAWNHLCDTLLSDIFTEQQNVLERDRSVDTQEIPGTVQSRVHICRTRVTVLPTLLKSLVSYKHFHKESCEYQPLPLQEFCRQSIRQRVIKHRNACSSIWPLLDRLPLPTGLIKYLQFDEFTNQNVFVSEYCMSTTLSCPH